MDKIHVVKGSEIKIANFEIPVSGIPVSHKFLKVATSSTPPIQASAGKYVVVDEGNEFTPDLELNYIASHDLIFVVSNDRVAFDDAGNIYFTVRMA